MARLSLTGNAERRKKILVVLIMWLEMCTVVSYFLILLGAIISLHTPRMSTSSKKRKANEMSESISAEELISVATLLSDKMGEIANKLSRSIGTETRLEEMAEMLNGALDEIDGLTEDEKDIALSKIPDHGSQMVVFFSLPPSRRLRWVRRFLSTH